MGKPQTENASGQPKRYGLCEEQPDQTAPAGSERGTDRYLALPRRHTPQEQVRDVGAGDQHETTDRGQEKQQGLT